MKNYFLPVLFLSAFLVRCTPENKYADPLQQILKSEHPAIKKVMDSLDTYQVQIRYTQIDRRNDSVIVSDFDFQVDHDNYFYPASTVKFPIAVLALEKLNRSDTLSRNIKFYIEGDSVEHTFATDISKIFAVSDNHANNRLLEYLGQDAINNGLRDKGVFPVRIAHRLGYHTDDVTTKPLIMYLNDSTTTITEPIINTAPKSLLINKIKKGSGFYEGDSLIPEAFDFGLKNYYPIAAQHGVLRRVIFPELFEDDQQFKISASQREFLLSTMHTLPKDAGYDPEEFYDGYCKFFMFGDSKEDIPAHIKIYNKVGFAYGTLTDCAYITDTKNGIEFMLTATILVNRDGIFNDDAYEYDEIGLPFLAALGRELYNYELNRKK